MDTWREMICSKSHGTHSKMLADEIATLAKRPHDGHHSTRLHINTPRMQTGSTEEK